MTRPTVREINARLDTLRGYCYIDLPHGRRIRVSRVRTRNGVMEGRVIIGSDKTWEKIPADAIIELS